MGKLKDRLKRYRGILITLLALLCIGVPVLVCGGYGVKIANNLWAQWVEVDNPEASVVEFWELQAFLGEYQVEAPTDALCGTFARNLHNEAEAQGIRAAIVASKVGEQYHAFNAFQTKEGIVYVDTSMGVCVIAQKVDAFYVFVLEHDGHIAKQSLGDENEFSIYW